MDPQYYRDIADCAIFGTHVSFTSKYPIERYEQVFEDQERVRSLLIQLIKHEANKTEQLDLPQIAQAVGFNEEETAVVGQIIKGSYNVYKAEIIKQQICMGSNHLSCLNWRLKNVLGCSQFTHKQKVILELELTISDSVDEIKEVVKLELAIHEARELLMKLKKTRKQLREGAF